MDRDIPSLAKKLKALRAESGLTQKEVAEKARVTESAYRAYELGDRNPKNDAYIRIAEVFDVSPEYLKVPTFGSGQELAYALLENEDLFGYTVCSIEGIPAIVPDPDPGSGSEFFEAFVSEWEDMRGKFDKGEISEAEYEKWKQSWNDGSWLNA